MAKTLSNMLPLGTKAPEFRLPNVDGTSKGLEDFEGSSGYLIAFICNHCPFVVHVREAFLEMAKDFQKRNIAVIAINSNDVDMYPDDSPEHMKRYADDYQFTFPYLFDESQSVAKAFQAACTPDFFLFDASKALVYRGQMDQSRPGNDKVNDGADLRAAVKAMMEGKEPLVEQRPSMGCNIKWKPGNEPS